MDILLLTVISGLIIWLIRALIIYCKRQWVRYRKKTKVIVLRYLKPVPKKKIKIKFNRLGGDKQVKDVYVPIIFSEPKNSNEVMFSVLVYNSSTKELDKNVQIKVDFFDPCIKKVVIDSNRVEVLEGGKNGSSFVSLLIKELIPEEKQSIKIFVRRLNKDIRIHNYTSRSKNYGDIPLFIGDVQWEDWK